MTLCKLSACSICLVNLSTDCAKVDGVILKCDAGIIKPLSCMLIYVDT